MNRILKTALIGILSAAVISPVAMADNRGRGHGGHSAPSRSTAQRSERHNNARPTNHGSNRPSQSGQHHSQNARPGSGTRPGNMGRPNNPTVNPGQNQGSHRPGATVGNRPGNNNRRPSGNHRPGNTVRPGNDRPSGPGNNHGIATPRPPQHHGNHGPVRPHMRPPLPFHRPTPPPAWRPAPAWRPFRTILGVALGSALNFSINSLISSGYTVASYGNNEIYLNNVPMLNLMWPDAIMYYNSAGMLYGSRFIYSTSGYSMNQYNMAYTSLTANYGAPVSIQALPNGTEATWWGTGNQFIRLSYQSDYANNGQLRYYTTLSFGN